VLWEGEAVRDRQLYPIFGFLHVHLDIHRSSRYSNHRRSRYKRKGGLLMNFDKNLLGGTTGMLLLSLLSDQDMYGYEIIKELEIRSDSSFQFKEGTLYPVLHKMENMGWLKSYLSKGDAGRERKYYQITVKGKKQLTFEKEQWEVFTQSVEKVVFGGQYELAR